MSFMDFLTGSNNAPLSLAEVLSAIPAVAGPALMARGRRVGLPLGMGLTALGGLGEMMAQRQRQNAQAQGLSKAIGEMPGLTPDQQKSLSDFASAGGNTAPIFGELLRRQFAQPKGPQNIIELFQKDPDAAASFERMLAQNRPQPKPAKQGPFDVWRLQHPHAPIEDYFKASRPAISIDTMTPVPLSDVGDIGGGKPGVLMRSKGGSLVTEPAPPGIGIPPKKSAGTVKPIQPTQANAVTKQIDNEWALQPTEVSGAFSGARKRAFYAKRRAEIYANMGYDSNGQPFKPGQVVGRTATGDPIVWNP